MDGYIRGKAAEPVEKKVAIDDQMKRIDLTAPLDGGRSTAANPSFSLSMYLDAMLAFGHNSCRSIKCRGRDVSSHSLRKQEWA